jgi:GNAT superfamily N-acetyltransferase
MLKILPVSEKKEKASFIDFPHELYRNDMNYVPELFIAQRDLLDPKHHPFFLHSKLQLFIAKDENDKVVGRIAAIRNNNHNKFNGTNDGFFGFFDVIDDYEVAEKLLDTAKNWLLQEGLNNMIGPVNFSTNEPSGMLIDGFDKPPFVMMTHNWSYYPQFMDKYGFKKHTDLFAYILETFGVSDKSVKMTQVLEERLMRKGITIRPINVKKFKEEVAKIKKVYNSAWDKNLGFVPMTDEEFNYLANDLKLLLIPEFCLVAEYNGEFIGFSLAVPNVNKIQIKIKRGRLFPFGLIKLLLGKGKIDELRIITLGVLEDYRKMGIEAVFFGKNIAEAQKRKYGKNEASWILENNTLMNQAMINMGGYVHKTYRIYNKEI